jgi:hypothetical protein
MPGGRPPGGPIFPKPDIPGCGLTKPDIAGVIAPIPDARVIPGCIGVGGGPIPLIIDDDIADIFGI